MAQEIYSFLKNDIKQYSKTISVECWIDAILNVSPEQLLRWTSLLRQKPIVLDQTIEENMQAYRDRLQEQDGYLPWTIIANQVVKVAHDYLPDLPPYKLKDILFVRNDPIRIESPYSRRSPDVVITLKLNALRDILDPPTATNYFIEGRVTTEGITWYDVISCVEFRQAWVEKLLKGFEKDSKEIPFGRFFAWVLFLSYNNFTGLWRGFCVRRREWGWGSISNRSRCSCL